MITIGMIRIGIVILCLIYIFYPIYNMYFLYVQQKTNMSTTAINLLLIQIIGMVITGYLLAYYIYIEDMRGKYSHDCISIVLLFSWIIGFLLGIIWFLYLGVYILYTLTKN